MNNIQIMVRLELKDVRMKMTLRMKIMNNIIISEMLDCPSNVYGASEKLIRWWLKPSL